MSKRQLGTALGRLSLSAKILLSVIGALLIGMAAMAYILSSKCSNTTEKRTVENGGFLAVGITARADWRGPNVLNGRATTTGVSKDRQ